MAKNILRPVFDFDFVLYGIVCHQKDYRLCFEINKALGLTLERSQKNHEIPAQKAGDEISSHAMYVLDDEENFRSYFLIANKGSSEYLIPEQKQLDYLFILKGNYQEEEKREMQKSLKAIPLVLGCYELNPQKLKSKDNLVF